MIRLLNTGSSTNSAGLYRYPLSISAKTCSCNRIPPSPYYSPVSFLAGVVIVATFSVSALLSAINDIYRKLSKRRSAAIRGYTDAARIITYIFCAYFSYIHPHWSFSLGASQSPWWIDSHYSAYLQRHPPWLLWPIFSFPPRI